ncbi:MAG: hypothetical protein Q8K58_11130 [Acidimicrobiales bacterium]|nr:hypothetical protein [Acidimicrobiales bacterium]
MQRTAEAVPRRTRCAVYGFLVAFAITGAAHLEAWPFTGFRLFSERRGPDREGWEIVAVEHDGAEVRIDLSDLPVGARGSAKLIEGFADMSQSDRDGVCRAWVAPLRDEGRAVDEVRVYARVDSVRPDGPPPTRSLAYSCGARP